MAETTVVNLRVSEYDVYIGRANRRYGLEPSPYANPFCIDGNYSRTDVIDHYRQWVHESNDPRAAYIREHVHELRGKRLGCWCHPAACHGQVLAALAEREGKPLPTAADIFGIDPDFTGDLTTEEFIREIRGE